MVDKSKVFWVRSRKIRKRESGNIRISNGRVVCSDIARECSARLAEQSGFVGSMDDGLAGILCEEFKDDTRIGKLKAEHLWNKASATDGENGDDIGIGETTQPGTM